MPGDRDPEIRLIPTDETAFDRVRLVTRNLLSLAFDCFATASAIFKVATGLDRTKPLTPREQAAVALPEQAQAETPLVVDTHQQRLLETE